MKRQTRVFHYSFVVEGIYYEVVVFSLRVTEIIISSLCPKPFQPRQWLSPLKDPDLKGTLYMPCQGTSSATQGGRKGGPPEPL